MTPEIRAFEYALGLFAVLIGLAIADIASSFHRLIRRKATVTWDPLALAAALFALLMAIGMWFDLWGVRNVTGMRHFFFYLSLVAELFLLYLVAAASLPDELADRIDLRDFYMENRRYFWTLVALFQSGYIVQGLYFVGPLIPRMPRLEVAVFLGQWLALLALPILLASVRSRSVQYVGLTLLFALEIWHYAPYSIE